MRYQRGMVVRSKARHDKGSFYAVVAVENDTALVADGDKRTVTSPKRKKLIHLAFTSTVLSEQIMNDDTKIRQEILIFNSKVRDC